METIDFNDLNFIEDKLRVNFQFKYGFLGYMLSKKNIEWKDYKRNPYMAWTDGESIYFNVPALVLWNVDFDNLIFITAHEILHDVLWSFSSKGSRNVRVWNIAADYEINYLLKSGGIGKILNNVLFNNSFEGLNAERIYDILLDPNEVLHRTVDEWVKKFCKKAKKIGDERGQFGGNIDDFDFGEYIKRRFDDHGQQKDLSEPEIEEKNAEIRAEIGDYNSRQAGEGGDKILRDLIVRTAKKIDWKFTLKKFLMDNKRSISENFIPPERRFVSSGLYFPGINVIKSCKEIDICVDVSESVGNKLLSEFLAVVSTVPESLIERVNFWYFSTIAGDVSQVKTSDIETMLSKKKMFTTGGTHIACNIPVYNAHKKSRLLVIVSDGFDDVGSIKCAKPILWLIKGNSVFKKPAGTKGKIIFMD